MYNVKKASILNKCYFELCVYQGILDFFVFIFHQIHYQSQ